MFNCGAAFVITPKAKLTISNDTIGAKDIALSGACFFGVIGLLSNIIEVGLGSDDDLEFDMNKTNDVNDLKTYALFQNESSLHDVIKIE